jgi:hypothetical protein
MASRCSIYELDSRVCQFLRKIFAEKFDSEVSTVSHLTALEFFELLVGLGLLCDCFCDLFKVELILINFLFEIEKLEALQKVQTIHFRVTQRLDCFVNSTHSFFDLGIAVYELTASLLDSSFLKIKVPIIHKGAVVVSLVLIATRVFSALV